MNFKNIITLLSILICSSSLFAQISTKDNSSMPCPVTIRVYDCAANSLYVLSRKAGVQITYQKCIELLPFTHQGNSMLEFKHALETLEFKVEAQKLVVDELNNLRVPAVILVLCKN